MSPRVTTAFLWVLAIGVPALIIGFVLGFVTAPLVGHYVPVPAGVQLQTVVAR